jgi:hypothetical protein
MFPLNRFKKNMILSMQIQSLHLPQDKQTVDLGASDAASSLFNYLL